MLLHIGVIYAQLRWLQLTHRLIQQVAFNCEISLNTKLFLLLGNSSFFILTVTELKAQPATPLPPSHTPTHGLPSTREPRDKSSTSSPLPKCCGEDALLEFGVREREETISQPGPWVSGYFQPPACEMVPPLPPLPLPKPLAGAGQQQLFLLSLMTRHK